MEKGSNLIVVSAVLPIHIKKRGRKVYRSYITWRACHSIKTGITQEEGTLDRMGRF